MSPEDPADHDSWDAAFADAAREPDPAPESGAPLGRFTVQEELGRGGQGTVYRATQPGTGRPVAIKRMRRGALASASVRARFEREVRSLATLDHPGIVTVHAVEDGASGPILVMELVDGPTMVDWAATRDAADIVDAAIELADAVHHAHQRGVIHCDLKPSNVLMAGDAPRVLDFGIARFAVDDEDADQHAPATAASPHTPGWAAPEQLAVHPVPDVRTDVHGVGRLLDAALEARSRPRPVPADLRAILDRSLAPSPDDRYVSVAALAADLRRFRAHRSVEARPAGPWRTVAQLVRRRPISSIAAALAIVALFGLGIVTEQQRLRAETALATAERSIDLIRDVLETSGPGGLGATFDIDTLLAETESRATDELAAAPDSAARVLIAIGSIRTARWEWTDAERCFAAAERFARAGDGGLVLEALLGRGRALASLGRESAVAILEEAVDRADARPGVAGQRGRGRARMRLAYAEAMTAPAPDHQRVMSRLAAARTHFADAGPGPHRDLAACLHIQGFIQRRAGDNAAAIASYEAAWSILRRLGNERDPYLAELLYGMVLVHHATGHAAELAAMHEDAVRVLERAYRPERLGSVHGALAAAAERLGDVDRAWERRRSQLTSIAAAGEGRERLVAAIRPDSETTLRELAAMAAAPATAETPRLADGIDRAILATAAHRAAGGHPDGLAALELLAGRRTAASEIGRRAIEALALSATGAIARGGERTPAIDRALRAAGSLIGSVEPEGLPVWRQRRFDVMRLAAACGLAPGDDGPRRPLAEAIAALEAELGPRTPAVEIGHAILAHTAATGPGTGDVSP